MTRLRTASGGGVKNRRLSTTTKRGGDEECPFKKRFLAATGAAQGNEVPCHLSQRDTRPTDSRGAGDRRNKRQADWDSGGAQNLDGEMDGWRRGKRRRAGGYPARLPSASCARVPTRLFTHSLAWWRREESRHKSPKPNIRERERGGSDKGGWGRCRREI